MFQDNAELLRAAAEFLEATAANRDELTEEIMVIIGRNVEKNG